MNLTILAAASPAVTPLTEELRAQALKGGCEPTCHMCKEVIELGTEFGFFTMPTKQTVFVKFLGKTRTTKVMACRTCLRKPTEELVVAADQDVEKAEKREMREALTGERDADNHPGCVFVDDGLGPRML